MNRARRRVGPLAAGLLWNLGRITARPTSRYQTGAHALLRVAQDAVKDGKDQSSYSLDPGVEGCMEHRTGGYARSCIRTSENAASATFGG
jgi:hypothetical protein